MSKIPVCTPNITLADFSCVSSALETNQISGTSPVVEAFEQKWAAFCGKKYGIAVCNGTVALEMAVKAHDFPLGSEIIVPSFTIISCLTAILGARCTPVLVDCYPDTWTMNLEQVRAKITPKTVAIMPVHIYGVMVDMGALSEIAYDNGLYVIEDASEAHGASFGPWRAGQRSDVACFSFYANKIVTCGEGGMILCNEEALASRLRYDRDLSQSKDRRFKHLELGHNYRLGALQAALGTSQINHISETIYMKYEIARAYNDGFARNRAIQMPIECGRVDGGNFLENVYWMYGIVLKRGYDAEGVRQVLAQKGIETRPFFLGLHQQPVAERMGLFRHQEYPITEMLSKYGLYLPSGPRLIPQDVKYVIGTVNEVVQ